MQLCFIVLLAILSQTRSTPIPNLDPDPLSPLAVASDLNSRLVSHTKLLQGQESGLPLPIPQDFDAIKKVAQILVTLGQQVIPALMGGSQTSDSSVSVDVTNDPV